MLGLQERLSAKNKIRLKVSNVAREVWPQLVYEARISQEKREEFNQIIEYENQQLTKVDIPLFEQMLELFTAKMHLAQPSTRNHFPTLVEFVEMWHRSLSGALPTEVAERVWANEDTLTPFYTDLKTNFERLQASLNQHGKGFLRRLIAK